MLTISVKPVSGAERGEEFVVAVKNRVWYAHMLELGGKVIFAKSVVHPGIRPRRWFQGAVEESLPDLEAIFERELGAAVTKRSVVLA